MKKILIIILVLSLLVISGCGTGEEEYICNYNAYNCDELGTHAEAQEVYELCGGISNDVHHLDRDKDGLACEWNS